MMRFMVDIETWGLKPGAQIRSIAILDFSPGMPLTPVPGNYMHVRVDDLLGPVEPETVEWWEKQPQGVREHFDNLPVCTLASLPDRIREFVLSRQTAVGWTPAIDKVGDGVEFWARDPDYDRVMLEAAYRERGVPAHGMPLARAQDTRRTYQTAQQAFDAFDTQESEITPTSGGDVWPWQFFMWRSVRTAMAVAEPLWHVAEPLWYAAQEKDMASDGEDYSRPTAEMQPHNALFDAVKQAGDVTASLNAVDQARLREVSAIDKAQALQAEVSELRKLMRKKPGPAIKRPAEAEEPVKAPLPKRKRKPK